MRCEYFLCGYRKRTDRTRMGQPVYYCGRFHEVVRQWRCRECGCVSCRFQNEDRTCGWTPFTIHETAERMTPEAREKLLTELDEEKSK